MTLTDKNGNVLNLNIKQGLKAADGVVLCLKEVYKSEENYGNPEMFNKSWLIKEIENGNLTTFTGFDEADNTPAVTFSLRKSDCFPRALETTALAVVEKFRGFKIGEKFMEYAISEAEKAQGAGSRLFYGHAVMFYTHSVDSLEKIGFVPTGFILASCDADRHIPNLGYKSEKDSFAVYVKNSAEISEAAKIYVPEALKAFASDIYASLNAKVAFGDFSNNSNLKSEIEFSQNDYYKTLTLFVLKSGEDLKEVITDITSRYNDALQSEVLFLNISEPSAVFGFETLKSLGYIFTGFKPLCADKEFLIMAKTREVFIDCSEWKTSERLTEIKKKVGRLN